MQSCFRCIRDSVLDVGRWAFSVVCIVTVFLGCGFAAKYPEGGGNYSVPLQWMLGLRRLGLDAIWLGLLPATADAAGAEARIRLFRRRLREHGLQDAYSLLYQNPADDLHHLARMRCVGV